jgi:hypothetical protein
VARQVAPPESVGDALAHPVDTVKAAAQTVAAWHPAALALWAAVFVGLGVSAFYLTVWQWVTAVVIGFGIPEFIGGLRDDDRIPMLTHVIIKYVHRELSFPVFYGLAGGIGAHWFVGRPGMTLGLAAFAGVIGWVTAHFDLRYEAKERG